MSAVARFRPSEHPASAGPAIQERYIVKRELGRGGVCVVHEALHRFTRRPVALKVPLPEFSRNEEAASRLLLEATALGRVRHPCVVEAFDAGRADGSAYLVMELVERSGSLEGQLAKRGQLSVSDSLNILRRVTDAVATAHRAGVLHRDIKPGNVLLVTRPSAEDPSRQQTHVKLIDFGLAALIASDDPSSKLTRAETVLGTPEYMPLERLTATGDRHPASDVYALGVTLYECLAGTVPFAGSYPQVLRLVATATPKPIDEIRPDVPRALAHVIHKALSRDPGDRYTDARALCLALDAVVAEMGRADTPTPPEPARRKHPRAPYITPVRVTLDGIAFDASTEDISESGLLLLASGLARPGAMGEIRFALPTTGETVTSRLVVRWAKENKDHPRARCALGVELVNPEPRIQKAIADYVSFFGVC